VTGASPLDRFTACVLAAADPDGPDAPRGLFITADRIRATHERTREAFATLLDDIAPRLEVIAARFELDALDRAVLALAVVPQLDADVERTIAFLNDDATNGHLSAAVLAELIGVPVGDRDLVRCLTEGRLIRSHLVTVGPQGSAWPRRRIQVVDEVARALGGGDVSDQTLVPWVIHPVLVATDGANDLAGLLGDQPLVAHVHAQPGGSAASVAASALAALGLGCLAVRVPADASALDLVRRAARLATMQASGLYLEPASAVAASPDAMRVVLDTPVPVVLGDSMPWEPSAAPYMPITVVASPLDGTARVELWEEQLEGAEVSEAVDLGQVTAAWHLTSEQIRLAAQGAITSAMGRGVPIGVRHLRDAVRAQNLGRLGTVATRIEPRASFDDLVLDEAVISELRGLVARVGHRDRVVREWGFGGPRANPVGVTALFAGPPGTGKTMSAEVVANELQVDLYVIDLARIVDKYVGETEKNLAAVFDEAEGLDCVLLFDEADAIFGKRTGVSDARDRYANIEVAYLLQRMEQFGGVALLATNLQGNLDTAFKRRFDAIVAYESPDATARRRLWERHLWPDGGVGGVVADVDLDALAATWEISGGDIRNAVLSAAFAAAADDSAITMTHIERSLAR
jgi:hypothetical protein